MTQHYSFFHITQVIGGKSLLRNDNIISRLLIDSRLLIFPDETLFFALRSAANDGHKYVGELYDKGVRNFVVSNYMPEFEAITDSNFLIVNSTLTALQQLTTYHRTHFQLPVIGITGSNGKTIVKEWLSQLLHGEFNIVRSPRSYNSQTGVPLSVWQINAHHDLGIFEAGISKKGEMERLERIIRPTIGIFTNIGQAHQENFESLQDKCMEKLSLFIDTQWLISCKDHVVIEKCITDSPLHCRRFTWGFDPQSDIVVEHIHKTGKTSVITYRFDSQFVSYTIPFSDDASVENSMHCVAALLLIENQIKKRKPNIDCIVERMNRLEPVAMRLEVKEGRNGCLVINDSYNADINSLRIALDFARQQAIDKQLPITLILSDILQSGEQSATLYSAIANLTREAEIHRLIGVGQEISAHINLFPVARKERFITTEMFLKSGYCKTFHNEVVLLKGSRDFHFERISEQIENVAHQTTLEVNLSALVQNFNYFRSKLKPETKIICMVKAFAYGSGAAEVSKTLQYHRCDCLAVAVADEGAELRREGITLPVMVMNPEPNSFNLLFENHLEPEIYSFGLLASFIKTAVRQGVSNYPIHIKIDSGMHRLGFDPEDLDKLLAILKSQDNVRVQSIFSHLAGADEARFDAFTHRQATLFLTCADKLQAGLGYAPDRHLLNSAGIERFPYYQFEMVRLGIGLYGVSATNSSEMETVCTLRTTVLQVKNVKAGETVGYSRNGVVKRDSEIAVLPVGYADGYDRRFGNGTGKVMINGRQIPVIGNVCMDVTMIDVTGLDVHEGDSVELFGTQLPVYQVANSIGTIPYELLTNVSRRVKRVYFQE